ncbi:MAG TPA: LLM class flavin-dependent oxidoreductase [Candidatus Binataceae bacterium]|nr:LLM class flavin-dependent oxidoreductase [Candidatus Binataceae bacterium]
MRFTLMLSRGEYRDFIAIAQAAEAAGFASITMPDSLFFPVTTTSKYPYADTENIRVYISMTPFIEPLIAMTWMAAVTKTLRFYPAVMKVPVRQPLVLAKALSSLAVISNNRVSLGAGLSPWREDFAYNGMNFDRRGELMNESIEIIRGAMTGQYFEFHSRNYDIGPMKLNPVPDRPVPILYGGHSKPALIRAAKLCDGWISANAETSALKTMIDELNAYRGEFGTLGRSDYEIHVMDITASKLEDYRRLGDIGATDTVAGFVSEGQQMLDDIRRFGETVIAKF